MLRACGAALLSVVLLIALSLGSALGTARAKAHAAPNPPSAQASALLDATLRFGQSQYTVAVNDTITLDLMVEGVANLAGWEVKLSFDPDFLEVTQVAPGPFLSSTTMRSVESLQLAPAAGQLSLGGYSYGDLPAASGSGVLAHLTVRGLATGQADITLVAPILAGMDGSGVQSLPVGVVNSTGVTVIQPLAVTLAGFQATTQRDGILVSWETASELDTQGFNLYRAPDPAAPQELLAFIPSQAPGSSQGFTYEWLDGHVAPGQTMHYWLEDIDLAGVATRHGPVSATFQTPTAVTVAGVRAAHENRAPADGWILAGAAVLVAGAGVAVRMKRAQPDGRRRTGQRVPR